MPKRERESSPPQQQQAQPSTWQAQRAPKPTLFQINKIDVGPWSQDSTSMESLKARIYWGKRKFVWELDHQDGEKRKMEVVLDNVHSMQLNASTANGVIELELKNPPTFHQETEQKTQGKVSRNSVQIDDFTQNRCASSYRRHKLTVDNKVIKRIQEAIQSYNQDPWNELLSKQFPVTHDLHFTTEAEQEAGSSSTAQAQEQGETFIAADVDAYYNSYMAKESGNSTAKGTEDTQEQEQEDV